MTYTFRGNDWQLRVEGLMYGKETGLEYTLESATIVSGFTPGNPGGRDHNTSVFNMQLRLGNDLIGRIHATAHINFLNGRIVTEIDNLQSQCK